MQSNRSTVVVLGTGGTIAGTAADAADNVGYSAAEVAVEQLVHALPVRSAASIECEQVVQIDSKDMSHDVWLVLARRCAHHLAREDVAGIVMTHGTDTMEETAWFLQRVLAPGKPVVLTGAMRPATSLQPDGPQNLLDALCVAETAGANGVVVCFAGQVHGAREVRKAHTYRLDAFTSGDAGPLACVEEGRLRMFRAWPAGDASGCRALPAVNDWPWVEIVTSHAGAHGGMVRALRDAGVRGIVVAGTGNGTLHRDLEAALRDAAHHGVAVLRSSRCADGFVIATPSDSFPAADDLTPVKARIDLMLQLMSAG